MNKGSHVKILKPGDYYGETGVVKDIILMVDGGEIVEVTVDYDFLYEPIVDILVWKKELIEL